MKSESKIGNRKPVVSRVEPSKIRKAIPPNVLVRADRVIR
jgi:hypothetical protein